jgi:PAS domain S-box-containing protein
VERNPDQDRLRAASGRAGPPPAAAAAGGSPAPATSGGKGAAFDPRDLVPEPIFCCDQEGRLIWVNHAAEKLTGYGTSQLLGRPFAMLIAPTRRRRLTRHFITHLHVREEDECEHDVPLLTRDGRTAWVGARVRRVRALNGRVGYVACAHDLHDMMFEIENLKREVRDLRIQSAEAMAAAQLKGEFLAAVSEEIRSPMDGLLSMTRLLLESNLDRDQRTFAEVVHSSGQALLALVSDILDFSKIEAGALDIESLDFDVRVTVDGVAGLFVAAAQHKGVALERAVHHDVPSLLKGDPGRLRQVITNLARRLLHLLAGGQLQIWVTLVEETAHEVVLRFSLTYSSPTPAPALEEMVRAFVQPEASGSGIGGGSLAVAVPRRLVGLMAGEVGGEAQPGGGQIWFQIPLKRAEVRGPAAPLPDVSLQGMRVLVADPSVGMRMALTEILTEWGCVADEAEDGRFALTLLKEAVRQLRPYRVALIENQLPELDAEGLSAEIQADPELASTLLMMTTTVGRKGDAARARQLGFSAYLVKPFEPSHLRDALVEVVHRHQHGLASEGIVTRHSVAERRRQRTRILLVEDNSVNQLVAVAALRRAGFQPETAASASEAVQAHALQRFDIIFMDLELPDMDGLDAAREIFRMEEGTGRRTPIVAVTAHDAESMRGRCLAVGLKDCLAKPIDLDAMARAVERWTLSEAVLEPKVPEPEPARAGASGKVVVRAAEPVRLDAKAPTAPLRAVGAPVEREAEEAEPALDPARLRASSLGNPELEGILLRTFLHHIRPRLQHLREVAAAGDAAAVEFEAHGMKGMCATIGAMGCADAFARIEKLAREKRFEPVAPMLDYAEIEVARVEAVIGPMTQAA